MAPCVFGKQAPIRDHTNLMPDPPPCIICHTRGKMGGNMMNPRMTSSAAVLPPNHAIWTMTGFYTSKQVREAGA